MQYRVIPFVANIAMNQGAQGAAAQLEGLVSAQAAEGWEYVRLESVQTFVAGSTGCFGFGAVPATVLAFSMAVFRR